MLVGLLALAPALHAAPMQIVRTNIGVNIPDKRYYMTPYVRDDSVIIHLQPKERDAPELLLDARSGQPWQGTLQALSTDHQRLGSEDPDNVQRGSTRRADLRLLANLGCDRRFRFCTVPDDNGILLFVAYDQTRSRIEFELIDLRFLLAGMADLLAGRLDTSGATLSQSDWQVIQFAAQQPRWREAWIDALRSISDEASLQRISTAKNGLSAGSPALLEDLPNDVAASIDLLGELELALHRIHTRRLAEAWLNHPNDETIATLANLLERSMHAPFQGRLPTHIAAQMMELPDAGRRQLAAALGKQATKHRSDDLQCFSRWLLDQGCQSERAGDQAKTASVHPNSLRKPAPASSPRGATQIDSKARSAPEGVSAAMPITAGGGVAMAVDAPQEWGLIRRILNKSLLFSFDETSGRMMHEAASVGGLTFVARSLGQVQEGRFEVSVAPNARAPIRFARGQYRVKTKIALDFTREDTCRGGWLCIGSSAQRYAKVERREVVFYVNGPNHWTDRRPASFGHLLPLQADGSERYISRLKDVRLAVESVQIELN